MMVSLNPEFILMVRAHPDCQGCVYQAELQTWFIKSSLESRLMMFSFSLELSLLVWAHFRSAEVSEYSAV